MFDAVTFKRETGGVPVMGPDERVDGYVTDARGGKGKAAFIMRPGSTEEVSACVAFCARNGIDYVPQSGNTGLVGGSIPRGDGAQAVLSLERVKPDIVVNPENRSVAVSAGTRLSDLNAALEPEGMFLPIDLGADPMIGGMIATNTGGSRFLRYGDMRRHVLGLTVVLNDSVGTVLKLGGSLRKNNTGTDWKHLFIGSSGQFGIVTEAILDVDYIPRQQAAAIIVPATGAAVADLLLFLDRRLGAEFSAFEFMSRNAMRHAFEHTPSLSNPFAGGEIPELALVVELTRATEIAPWETPLSDVLEQALTEAWELPTAPLADALFGRAEQIWQLRHSLSEGVKAAGPLFAFDLSFERQQVIAFRSDMAARLPAIFPEIEICDFGHVGDGGLHFNLICHDPAVACDPGYERRLRDYVMACAVEEYNGSFSAEHGVGPKNQRYFEKYTPAGVRAMGSAVSAGLFDRPSAADNHGRGT